MFGGVFDPDAIAKKIAEQESLTNETGFWENPEKAQKVMNTIKMLKGRVEPWKELKTSVEDMDAMYELAEESGDSSLESDLLEMYEETKKKYEKESGLNLLSG